MFVLSQIIREGSESQRSNIVFHVFNDKPSKDLERQRRGEESGIQLSDIDLCHTLQQRRKLLRCVSSKNELIEFIVNE